MSLVLKINNTDRSSWIEWRSLRKTEGLTKEPDSLSFSIKKIPGRTIPSLGDAIILEEDTIKIFSGTITERNEEIIGGVLVGYNFRCKDPNHTLDRMLVVKSYENMSAEDIVKDIIDTFTTGFTYVNVATGTPTIESAKFNYEQPSKAIQKIAQLIGYDWYVDYDNDIHFFPSGSLSAPFQITDTNGMLEWQTLSFDRNIIELKNSVVIRGGEYKSEILEANAVDKSIADGTQRVFMCIYRYSNIVVKVNGTSKTVGIDAIDDPASFDVLYNFQEKAIKFRDDNKPSNGQSVVIYGDAFLPVIAKVRDNVSIATYGEYQTIEIDKTINSIAEAKLKAKSVIDKWSEGSWDGSFKTTQTGLRTGQNITINSATLGINKSFRINRITGATKTGESMEYTVQFLSSGELTFTDIMVGLVGDRKLNIDISDNEVLQRLELIKETLSIEESDPVGSSRTGPYTWGTSGASDFDWNFGVWG